MVYVEVERPTVRPNAKLDHRRSGPFQILERIDKVVYRVNLPPTWKSHNVFHVSKLEPAKTSELNLSPRHPIPECKRDEEFYYIKETTNVR